MATKQFSLSSFHIESTEWCKYSSLDTTNASYLTPYDFMLFFVYMDFLLYIIYLCICAIAMIMDYFEFKRKRPTFHNLLFMSLILFDML